MDSKGNLEGDGEEKTVIRIYFMKITILGVPQPVTSQKTPKCCPGTMALGKPAPPPPQQKYVMETWEKENFE